MTIVEVQGLVDDIVADEIVQLVRSADQASDTRGIVLQMDSSGVVVDRDTLAGIRDALEGADVPTAAWVGPSGSTVRGGADELLGWVDEVGIANGASIEASRPVLDSDPNREIGRIFDDEAAVRAGLADRVAPTLGDFVVSLDWVETKVVERGGERRLEPVTVARFESLPLGVELMHTMASPPVAYLALVIGLGLLMFEFFTAGVGVAGGVGAVSLVLSGYGLGALGVRGWAVGCIVAGVIAISVDVQSAVPRFWTALGTVLFIVGTGFLYDGVPTPWVAFFVGVAACVVTAYSGMPSMVRARFGTPTVGRDHMVGTVGEVVSAVDPDGLVRIDGALWRARTHRLTPIGVGDKARVVAIDGLELEVEPPEGGAVDYRELRSNRPSTGGEAGASNDDSA